MVGLGLHELALTPEGVHDGTTLLPQVLRQTKSTDKPAGLVDNYLAMCDPLPPTPPDPGVTIQKVGGSILWLSICTGVCLVF